MATKPHTEFYLDNAGRWRWRAIAGNGQIVASSGQGYSSRRKAAQGMKAARKAMKRPVNADKPTRSAEFA